ncbi:HAD family hydrolase [Halolamina sp.]|jgi:HAD superfamily hydrolase (TIGR01549 family)|uniref:HAD family hydrolase n=1 Tax=Halolamina sp. TaxID=1940283 RepID=UPI000223BFF8|nr:HAD-superfamily hydrolase, subfamily IA, variant 1 [halophilic archaeon DL31]
MTYDAVVFDNDGVLVDTTEYDVLHEAAWRAFEEVGVQNPEPAHVEEIVVGVTPESLAVVCDTYNLSVEAFWEVRDRTSHEAQRRHVHAGGKPLFEDVPTLADLDIPMGVVSSNQQETVDFLLEHFGVSELFDTAYGRQPTMADLRRKKPDPHFLEQALADLDAEDALYVGDRESDITAAVNAGIDSAFIRRPHREYHDLSVRPTHEVDDLHDVRALCR